MPHCTGLIGFNQEGFVKHIRCGRWSCPTCSKINARLWAWRVRLQIKEDQTWYMWTLTLGSKYKTPEQGFAAWPKLWNALRMAVTRYYQGLHGKSWKWMYCAFVEGQAETRSGMPHFHILTTVKPPVITYKSVDRKTGEIRKRKSGRIKDFAVRMGFGYQADLKEVNDKRAASYVAKYASKGDPSMPKGFRRVRPSQDWAHLPDYEGGTLYVPNPKETLTGFLVRVANATGESVDDLWERWSFARELGDNLTT